MREDHVTIHAVSRVPLTPEAKSEITTLCGKEIIVDAVDNALYQQRIKEVFGLGAEALAQETSHQLPTGIATDPLNVGVVRFVHELLEEAVRRRASDLHLEPIAQGLLVKLRVDGLLTPVPVPEDLSLHRSTISARLKVLAGMDPTPSRHPIEGRLRYADRDLRVSILPTRRGEAIHIRFLTRLSELCRLAELGVTNHQRTELLHAVKQRSGLLVCCGPTGSGKSTTLHVLIREGVPNSQKVITVEDPVEYELPDAVQVEVTQDLPFTKALKMVLRHDPDIILLGEMRDSESAQIAVQAALTGHLVLTSLHTDDAVQAVTRLRNLGIPNGLIAASLQYIITQRLIRLICTTCDGDRSPNESMACATCGGIGYAGRTGLFGITHVNALLRHAIEEGAHEKKMREILHETGLYSLRARASELADAGRTTTEEVKRVFGQRDVS
jgi:general secretion pathway protein E